MVNEASSKFNLDPSTSYQFIGTSKIGILNYEANLNNSTSNALLNL